MTQHEKKNLFRNYFAGSCSPKEEEEVKRFLQKADEDEELNQILNEAWEEKVPAPEVSPREATHLYQRISRRLWSQREKKEGGLTKQLPPPLQSGWRIAASLAFLILLSGIGYRFHTLTAEEKVRADFGETVSVRLPDNSKVILNGNSSIRFKKRWNGDLPREVWLDGEGFFSVRPTSDHQKFVVHTANEVAIEVLGTSFTAVSRNMGTRVVLNDGKIRLNLPNSALPSFVDLLPGDLVQVRSKDQEVTKGRVNPADYSAWTEKTLVFRSTSLQEIASLLEETYGLNVIIADSSLLQKRVSGSTPITPDLDLFFVGLGKTFDLTVSRKGNQVLISK